MKSIIRKVCAVVHRVRPTREFMAYDAMVRRLSHPKAQAELTSAYKRAGVRFV